jgi:TPP-dependent pyruvate/acetoin dehydrogenase alpha subunit
MFRKKLEEAGLWETIDDMAIEKEVDDIVNDAVAFAENGTLEPLEELEKFVYSEEVTHG